MNYGWVVVFDNRVGGSVGDEQWRQNLQKIKKRLIMTTYKNR